MGLDESKVMDLSKYGGEGYVELAYPTLRRKDKFEKEYLSMIVKVEGKEPIIDASKVKEAEFVRRLAYVETGPFDSLESFYDFTDKLDAKRRGAGEEFRDDFIRLADEIAEGKTSPSAGSPTAE